MSHDRIFAVRLYLEPPLSLDQPVRVGQTVPVGVEVQNVSPDPQWIVGVLDGSEVGIRYPHYRPQIEGPDYEPAAPEWPEMTSPLRPESFRRLAPGETFDPMTAVPGSGYLPLIALRDFTPPAAGLYRVRLTLSTESERDEQWLGTLPDPGQARLLDRIASIPRCTVTSDELIVDVR